MSLKPLAYRWRAGGLRPIEHPARVRLEDLLHIERQKSLLVQNTRQFVEGRPANHALLTGARGTGKSSLVKALLPAFAEQGLRLVELVPDQLTELPEIVAPLRGRPERFLLYVDDFSVGAQDARLTALKTALDGGLEEPPENVLIVATSNRRHLLPTLRTDNGEFHWIDEELHPGESSEEKISLSERFGLWLSFAPFDQTQYLDAVQHHLGLLGLQGPIDEAVSAAALRWALHRASRSGRVAQQFARDWVGRAGG
ncbi:MAG TPA: ATP-binding protein [Nevskiaceae bacterium]|nr:ATP-binding protein [Nevskiaceae bacterium]